MTKIKKIERQETKLLVDETLKVLQKAMNKYGIEVGQANGARYGGDTMTVKIEFKVPALSEERAESDYRLYIYYTSCVTNFIIWYFSSFFRFLYELSQMESF